MQLFDHCRSLNRMPSTEKTSSEHRPISPQATIAISIGAVIVLCFLMLAAALDVVGKREARKFSQIHINNLAQQMARELSFRMDEFASEIAVQATRNRFRKTTYKAEQIRTALDELKSARPDFAWIGVIDDATGRVLASTGGVFEQGDMLGRAGYERGRQGSFVGDIHRAVKLAALLPQPANGEASRFLDVAAPIKDEQGNTFRMLAAQLRWEWTDRLYERLLGPVADRHGVELMLADVDGNLALTSNPGLKFGTPIDQLAPHVLERPSGLLRWNDGRDYLTATTAAGTQGRFPGFGWTVIVRQSDTDVVGPTEIMRNSLLAGALILGLGTAVIAWLVAGRVIRPVRAMAPAAMPTSLQTDEPSLPKIRIGELAQMHAQLSHLTSEDRALSRSANAREQQFTAFADSLPELVWQADATGQIVYANRQWLQLLGEYKGARLDSLAGAVHPAELTILVQHWQHSRQSGSDLSMPVRLALLPVRSFEWFSLRGRAVRQDGGEIFGWVGTLSNIHESVRRSERIEQELSEERTARAEAERALRLKDDFLATLSHELRTPLNAISGWAQVLVRRPDIDPFVRRAADVINRNVQLQAALITDLLDMSAVISGNVTLQRQALDGAALVSEVVQSFQSAATEKLLLLTRTVPRQPVMIMADIQRLRQVLENLLSNALKFTDAGGKVHVAVLATAQHLAIKITDTGVGIAADFLPHVFDRFRQEDVSSARRRGGLGLGLALSKSLVELHQGSIRAASEGIGHGCEIAVILPLIAADVSSPSSVPEQPTKPQESGRLDGMKILVTDDEPDTREAIATLLSSLGATVLRASCAAETISTLSTQAVDLLLCDIAMPVTDGYCLIRQLRAGAYPHLSAIALSAFARQQDRQRAYDAGFDAYLAKPVTAQRLVEAIRELAEPS